MIAGLSTGIGSAAAFFVRKTNSKFFAVSLGFSAGVMIYISMCEILAQSDAILSGIYGNRTGFLISSGSFFAGMLLICLIDSLIPDKTFPENTVKAPMIRTGIMAALAISIHNFPEGLATFISALRDPELAIPVVAALAIHNIPEGIAVSVPIYGATGSRKRAFVFSLLSGLTEPVGAIIGYLFLMPVMSDAVYGILYGMIAGIMVFISFDELFPTSMEYGDVRLSVFGVMGGMAVMAASLCLLS